MNTIAVGVDLSPESEAAAHWAAASARDGVVAEALAERDVGNLGVPALERACY